MITPGSLRGRTWKRFLRGPDPSLLDELYVPALAEAVRYDRCCAYFSSSVLAAAARGFGRLIERLEAMGDAAPRPAVRLVVNEELAEDDVRALVETGDTSALEDTLRRRLKTPTDLLQKQRLAMLGWLVKKGLLEVRVGVMRRGFGVVHAKFGVMTDESGDAVVFGGSGNESAQGVLGNYEMLDMTTSWDDGERYREYAREFETLWTDSHADVHTVSLPEALRLRLIKFAPREAPICEPSNALSRQKAAMIWRFIVEAPYLPNGVTACDATAMVDLWPHQVRVVEETSEAWPEGRLLCDEVGMGKTIEAILVLRRLMAGRGVRRVLFLLPAGLLKQWQAELREKGGLLFPRLEGVNALQWPDDHVERISGISEALDRDVLLMSRETARTENNVALLLKAAPWDLVVLDESHAARRSKQEEGGFNSATLLLELLRQLQLRRRTRGFLLLSATPMQTHPWEPWDLLSVLGAGNQWLAEFAVVRDFYQTISELRRGHCGMEGARRAASIVAEDADFPAPPDGVYTSSGAAALATKLAFARPGERESLAEWLRHGSPLARHMHRNTRASLRRYHQMGLIPDPPPVRQIQDEFFDYEDPAERRVYNAVSQYIVKRFEELEAERPGKGFVMTIYRRRATSSPFAIERSLERRREGLRRVAEQRAYDLDLPGLDAPETLDPDELPEDISGTKISAALPQDPHAARRELAALDPVLEMLHDLRGRDTKRECFYTILRRLTEDGRPALVFTEYADTLEYLRDTLVDHYGRGLGCYSGEGGQRWDGTTWLAVTKDAITKALKAGELRVLLCTDAASEGLNLQAAGALVNYDLPWNPSRVEQRIGRIDRIGQRFREILIANLFLEDSVDLKVYKALQRRCGLFVHFVGAMQPVLARARRMLMGQDQVDVDALDAVATDVEQSPAATDAYLESAPGSGQVRECVLDRAELAAALGELSGEFGPRTVCDHQSGRIEVASPGAPKKVFGRDVDLLESDRKILPLSSALKAMRETADVLHRTGERLPLVVGTIQRGGFRRSTAYWVGNGALEPVSSLKKLRRRVDAWTGDYPDPALWLDAQKTAEAEAAGQVAAMDTQAVAKEHAATRRQVQAARIRLQLELGRYLACLGAGTTDLNGQFHMQMARDIASAQRLKKAIDRLGGYPEWPEALCQDLDVFVDRLNANQRKARLLGKELDAAIEDPRWMVAAEADSERVGDGKH